MQQDAASTANNQAVSEQSSQTAAAPQPDGTVDLLDFGASVPSSSVDIQSDNGTKPDDDPVDLLFGSPPPTTVPEPTVLSNTALLSPPEATNGETHHSSSNNNQEDSESSSEYGPPLPAVSGKEATVVEVQQHLSNGTEAASNHAPPSSPMIALLRGNGEQQHNDASQQQPQPAAAVEPIHSNTTLTTTTDATPSTPKKQPSTPSSAQSITPKKQNTPPSAALDFASNINKSRIDKLETQLAEAQAVIAKLQQHNNAPNNNDMMALQENLQQQMTVKAELEEKLRHVEKRLQESQQTIQQQVVDLEQLPVLQENLERQMTARAEAEHKARSAYERVDSLEKSKEENVGDLKELQKQVAQHRHDKEAALQELEKVRHERDTYERKHMSLTSRLNEAKKQEGVKLNMAERYEEDVKALEAELEATKLELTKSIAAKDTLVNQLEYSEKLSEERQTHFEETLAEEKRLNEVRKQKMKSFVEVKTEELRQAKEDNDALQIELTQTNRSLVDINDRWKQLHNQWVQAQTRNRELQRDLNRIKKDSENLHKQGDTLEMKLSRSANETEQHKNKRLAAKNELMAVLRALDAEREVTEKLRNHIKFSMTPVLRSQQQELNSCIDEFEASLSRLALRLRKPLPPLSEDYASDNRVDGTRKFELEGSAHSDMIALVSSWENESQKVTQSLTMVSSLVQQLRGVVDASGDRNCFTAFTELVTPVVHHHQERASITGVLPTRNRQGYGQVPESREMT